MLFFNQKNNTILLCLSVYLIASFLLNIERTKNQEEGAALVISCPAWGPRSWGTLLQSPGPILELQKWPSLCSVHWQKTWLFHMNNMDIPNYPSIYLSIFIKIKAIKMENMENSAKCSLANMLEKIVSMLALQNTNMLALSLWAHSHADIIHSSTVSMWGCGCSSCYSFVTEVTQFPPSRPPNAVIFPCGDSLDYPQGLSGSNLIYSNLI